MDYFFELGRWEARNGAPAWGHFSGHGFRHQVSRHHDRRNRREISQVQLFCSCSAVSGHGRRSIPHLPQYFPRDEAGETKVGLCRERLARAAHAARPHSALCRDSGARPSYRAGKIPRILSYYSRRKRAPHRSHQQHSRFFAHRSWPQGIRLQGNESLGTRSHDTRFLPLSDRAEWLCV